MTALADNIKQIASLNRAPGPTWTDATKRKAPHKPLLLLTVLDLVHRGVHRLHWRLVELNICSTSTGGG